MTFVGRLHLQGTPPVVQDYKQIINSFVCWSVTSDKHDHKLSHKIKDSIFESETPLKIFSLTMSVLPIVLGLTNLSQNKFTTDILSIRKVKKKIIKRNITF
jgi:hypothetical protein